MAETILNIPAFEIGVEGLGMYPSSHKPRVIWLGIKNGAPLAEIHQKLDFQLQKAGIPPDKRDFNPHLTIARVRRNAEGKLVQDIGKKLSQFRVDSLGKCVIDHIVIYKSVLTPNGPIYTALLSSPLNKV